MADQDQTDQQPTFWHGLMSGLQQAPANPLVNMGLGLMQAAAPFGNVGTSLMNANAATIQNRGAIQQQQIQRYQLERAQAIWPIYEKILGQVGNRFAPQGASSAPTGGAAPQGIAAPQGGMPQVTQGPNPYAVPGPMPPVSGDPVGDLQLSAAAKSLGAPLPIPSPEESQKALDLQNALRKQQISEPLAQLKTISGATDADKRVASDPNLKALWDQQNPGVPLTSQSARAFVATLHNQISGSVPGGETIPVPFQYKTVQEGLGQSYKENPLTLERSNATSAVPTDKYIVNGQVVELPKAAGVAKGLTPYDPQLLGAQMLTPESMEQAYQVAKAKGDLTEQLSGRDQLAQGKLSNYIAKRAGQDGVTGLQMAAQKQAYAASQGVLNDFLDPNGKAGSKLTAINTITSHASELNKLIDAMETGNLTKINQAKIAYQKATGSPAPTNFQAMANIFSGEAANAITQAGGDQGERESIREPFQGANSPAQIRGAINTTAAAMAGKTAALRNQWKVGTQGTQGDFDNLLLPETKQFLAQGQTPTAASKHPANIQKLLDKYAGPK